MEFSCRQPASPVFQDWWTSPDLSRYLYSQTPRVQIREDPSWCRAEWTTLCDLVNGQSISLCWRNRYAVGPSALWVWWYANEAIWVLIGFSPRLMLREEESARHCRGRGSFFCLDRKTQRTKNAEFSRWRNKCVTGTVTSHLPRHLDGAFYDCSVSGTSTAPPAGFPSHSFASSRAQPLSTISVNPIVNKLRDKGRQINNTPLQECC